MLRKPSSREVGIKTPISDKELFARAKKMGGVRDTRADSVYKTGAEVGNALKKAGADMARREKGADALKTRLEKLKAKHATEDKIKVEQHRAKIMGLEVGKLNKEFDRKTELRSQRTDALEKARMKRGENEKKAATLEPEIKVEDSENSVDVDFDDIVKGGKHQEVMAAQVAPVESTENEDEIKLDNLVAKANASMKQKEVNKNVLRGDVAVAVREKQRNFNFEASRQSFERVQKAERDVIAIYQEKYNVSDEQARMDVLVNFKLGWGITSWSRRLRESYKNYQNVLKQEEGKFESYQSTMVQERADEAVVKERIKKEKFERSDEGKARKSMLEEEREREKGEAEDYFKHTKKGKEIMDLTE